MMKALNRFLEVGKSLFLGLTLAGDIEFQALGNVPLPFTPNGSRERSLHDLIVSHVRVLRRVAGFESGPVSDRTTGVRFLAP